MFWCTQKRWNNEDHNIWHKTLGLWPVRRRHWGTVTGVDGPLLGIGKIIMNLFFRLFAAIFSKQKSKKRPQIRQPYSMLGCQSPDKDYQVRVEIGCSFFWMETLSLTFIIPQRNKDVAIINWDYVSTSTTSRNNQVCLHLKVFSRVPKLASPAQCQVVEILTKRRTMRRIHQVVHLFSRVFGRHGSGKSSRSNEEEKRNDLHLVAWHDLVGSRWLATTVDMRQDCCGFIQVRPLFRCFLWFDLTVFTLLLLWNSHHHLFLNRIDKTNMSPMDNNISRADLSHKYEARFFWFLCTAALRQTLLAGHNEVSAHGIGIQYLCFWMKIIYSECVPFLSLKNEEWRLSV